MDYSGRALLAPPFPIFWPQTELHQVLNGSLIPVESLQYVQVGQSGWLDTPEHCTHVKSPQIAARIDDFNWRLPTLTELDTEYGDLRGFLSITYCTASFRRNPLCTRY